MHIFIKIGNECDFGDLGGFSADRKKDTCIFECQNIKYQRL
jgi:hypothetical protein